MNINEYSVPSEQLSALLDGELGMEESSTLFYSLAHNSDLQSELQDLLKIRNKMPALQLHPPDKLKKGILIGTGLAATSTIASSALNSAGASFWSKIILSKPFLMLMTASLATMMTYYITSKNHEFIKSGETKTTASQIPKITSGEQQLNTIPPKIIYITKKVFVKVKPDDNFYTNPLPVFTGDSNNNIQKIPIVENREGIELSNVKNNLLSLALNTTQSNFLALANTLPVESNKFIDKEQYSKIVVQMRHFNANTFIEPKVSPLISPAINNIGLAFLYEYSKNESVGIEIGQENFQQNFSATEWDGMTYYYQNYLGFWYGITYKYTFDDIKTVFGIDIRPYLQTFFGGTQVGAIGKISTGIQLDIGNNLIMFSGFDGTLLGYIYKDKLFTTRKAGVTYGLGFRL
jgi:hypothetical protein